MAARNAVPRVRAWGRQNGTYRWKVPRAREAIGVDAKVAERVLVLLEESFRGRVGRHDMRCVWLA